MKKLALGQEAIGKERMSRGKVKWLMVQGVTSEARSSQMVIAL
jgi:hypothetical protein